MDRRRQHRCHHQRRHHQRRLTNVNWMPTTRWRSRESTRRSNCRIRWRRKTPPVGKRRREGRRPPRQATHPARPGDRTEEAPPAAISPRRRRCHRGPAPVVETGDRGPRAREEEEWTSADPGPAPPEETPGSPAPHCPGHRPPLTVIIADTAAPHQVS